MKTLKDFEIKVPMLLMDGGIPMKGYTFYVSFDNETYYGAEFDKMTIKSHMTMTRNMTSYALNPTIYFHCAKGNFSAEFYENDNYDVVCAELKDADTNQHISTNIYFYASRNAIENGKEMRMSFGFDNVKFKGLPFFEMKKDEHDENLIMGLTYTFDEHNNMYTMLAFLTEFDVVCKTDMWNATNMRFTNYHDEEVDLDKCFAVQSELALSVKPKYKIIELPKEDIGAKVIIELL